VTLASIWRFDTTDNSPARPPILIFPAPKNIVGNCYVFRALKVAHLVLHRTRQLNAHRQDGLRERLLQNSKENADQHTIGGNILSVHAGHYCLLTSYTVAQFLCYLTMSAAQIIKCWRHMNEYGALVE
jgi:hypothetical protein